MVARDFNKTCCFIWALADILHDDGGAQFSRVYFNAAATGVGFFSWNQVSIAWSTASKYCPLSSKQTKNNWRIHILKQVPLEDISSSVCSGHSLLCGLRNDDKDVLGYERTYKSSRNCYENSLYSIRSSLSSKRYFVISIHHFFMRTIP